MIWGEISNDGVVTSYGHDALGSVTDTFSNGSLLNTYRFKPFGGTLAKTGVASDPRFLWNGGIGYRSTSLSSCSYYVQARHYSSNASTWTTRDPMWPEEHEYAYADSNPTTYSDPTGLATLGYTTLRKDKSCSCTRPYGLPIVWKIQWTLKALSKAEMNGYIIQLVHVGYDDFGCPGQQPRTGYALFFEAWQVVGGVIYQGYQSHGTKPGVDTDSSGAMGMPGCTNVKWQWEFEAKYFPNYVLNWPDNPGPDGPLPVYYLSPGQSDIPGWWFTAPQSNPVDRFYDVNISCCNSCTAKSVRTKSGNCNVVYGG